MARNKPEPRGLFQVKHDFYASLDEMCQQAILLHQTVEQALELGQISDIAASPIRQRLDAFLRALTHDDAEGEGTRIDRLGRDRERSTR